MARRFALACVLIGFAGWPARAQVPYGSGLLPSRTALARLGLERHWMTVVPLSASERVLELSIADDLVFAQTNLANFHVYDAESGQLFWTATLGPRTGRALPASVNSFSVFVTNANYLFVLDRRTGRTIWIDRLDSIPSSPTACDEHRVIVGLSSGRVLAYFAKLPSIKIATATGAKEVITTRPTIAWNWQTNGAVVARPLPAGSVTAFGGLDGKVYVAMSEAPTLLYRFAIGGQVAAPMGTYGTRSLLIPSTDQNVYAVDLWAAQSTWVFSTGARVQQEPLVADDDVYVVNTAGVLSAVDARTGVPRWSTSTHGDRLIAVSKTHVYLESHDDDLLIIDRATGGILADPRATFSRAGLNLREYALGPTNNLNDRLYFGTPSGLVICLREIGQVHPRPLRDPKAPPFGYIPPAGIKLTRYGAVAVPGQEPVPGAEVPAGEKKTEAAPSAEKEEMIEAPK